MPIQNKSIPKNYDADDMQSLASMAECDMQWMNTAINHIRREIIKLKELAKDGKQIYDFHFSDLIHHVDMYEYLAEETERYSKEWEQLKGGRNA